MNVLKLATACRAGRWSLATAALAVAGICASPLFPATPASQSDDAFQKTKNGTYHPTAMTDEGFEKVLGIPAEDAGGGWHAVLGKSCDIFREALTSGGYTVNTMQLDYANKSVIAHIAGGLPDGATVARYSQEAVAQGFETKIVPVWRTLADAITQQERIINDLPALATRGIEIDVTGITLDAKVRVDVCDGTQEQADYLNKTYGPEGLQINIGATPHPREAPLHTPPPADR